MNRTSKIKLKAVLSLIAALAVMLAVVSLMPITVSAAENPLRFTVAQVFTSSSDPADGTFIYRLNPLDPDNPMPQGGTAFGYDVTITGNSSVEIGPVNFTRGGIYRYELAQVIDAEKPGYTCDRRIYTIEVHVDTALNVALVVINVDGTKADNIVFENGYSAPPDQSVPPVDPGKEKPDGGNEGKPGPPTGDELEAAFYYALFVLGVVAAAGIVVYLIRSKRRKQSGG